MFLRPDVESNTADCNPEVRMGQCQSVSPIELASSGGCQDVWIVVEPPTSPCRLQS